MVYKYVSLGMNFAQSGAGKISYLHDSCAHALNLTLGPNAEPFDGEVPQDSKCPWCRKLVKEEAEEPEMAEADRSCFNCKYGLDEGKMLCTHGMTPGNYEIIDWDPAMGCENYEEAAG